MDAPVDREILHEFIGLCGVAQWRGRLAALQRAAGAATRCGRMVLQVHGLELTLERLATSGTDRILTAPERNVVELARLVVATERGLGATGRERLRSALGAGLAAEGSLIPVMHLVRTAALQRSRGFAVTFAGLEDGAPFDLLLCRDGVEAEIACEVMSAEDGHRVHRGAWYQLVDRVDPELQQWLRAHPGRYLLKLTFPAGLTSEGERALPELHRRIGQMLAEQRRSDADAAVVLRLDPLMLAAAQADELGLMPRLRREFGPEAHLAVTAAGGGVFVMAARAGQQNAVAIALRQRLEVVAKDRLTGTRPGILSMFLEDVDRLEWRLLRERLELEGETRQFLTCPQARAVVAVTCLSRLELFGVGEPDGVEEGELRFRNPAHPAAKRPELAAAVLSSL